MRSIWTVNSTHDYGWLGGGCVRARLAMLGGAVGATAPSGGGSVG